MIREQVTVIHTTKHSYSNYAKSHSARLFIWYDVWASYFRKFFHQLNLILSQDMTTMTDTVASSYICISNLHKTTNDAFCLGEQFVLISFCFIVFCNKWCQIKSMQIVHTIKIILSDLPLGDGATLWFLRDHESARQSSIFHHLVTKKLQNTTLTSNKHINILLIIIIIIERIRLGWHKPTLQGRLTNKTKIHAFQSGKLREKSSVLSRHLKVD